MVLVIFPLLIYYMINEKSAHILSLQELLFKTLLKFVKSCL